MNKNSQTHSKVIVGIGNPYRGDDGAGWAVIDSLAGKTEIHLLKQKGDIAELMEVFESNTHVILVDACIGQPGGWLRIDVHKEPLTLEENQTSTHGLSIKEAIALAKNLNCLPQKLVVYAIAGNQYHMSEGLSPKVSQAIDEVAKAILEEREKTQSR